MCADMLPVIRGPDIGLHAEGAVVRSLARVQTLVLLQCALMRVSLAAYITHVWLESRVCLQVTLQVAELLESPVAVWALKGTLLHVDPAAFFHGDQKPSDLVIFMVFERRPSRSLFRPFFLLGLPSTSRCGIIFIVPFFKL